MPSEKTAAISLRIEPKSRDLIDQAALVSGRNRTDFMVDAARREAIAVLLDRRLFSLDAKSFAAFQKALDEPAKPSAALKRLMTTPAPWEK